MPPDLPETGSPEDWLDHARGDLVMAGQVDLSGVRLGTLCFHAQQAAEKSLKSVLVQRGVRFPYTHDLARLLTLLRGAGILLPEDLDDAVELSDYAVTVRYPGPLAYVTQDQYRRAIDIAGRVLAWAEDMLRQ